MLCGVSVTLRSPPPGSNLSGVAAFDRLGTALQALRSRAGLSQRGLEATAGLSTSSISRYENGERPSLATLQAILSGLGCSLHELASALDQADGVAGAQRGRANARWVAALSGRPLDEDRLFGFAAGVLDPGDAQAREDFVASVETVASELARRVVAELDASPKVR